MARVVVDVMLKPEILDPQGQAVANALPRLGVSRIRSVRIGKRIELEFEGEPDLDQAHEIADKLLANPVIEDFTVRVEAEPEPEAVPEPEVADESEPDAVPEPAAAEPSESPEVASPEPADPAQSREPAQPVEAKR